MEKKLGLEPAFAKSAYVSGTAIDPPQNGMSKRFYAACAAMQGMLANSNTQGGIIDIVKTSYEFADELLKQENQ